MLKQSGWHQDGKCSVITAASQESKSIHRRNSHNKLVGLKDSSAEPYLEEGI